MAGGEAVSKGSFRFIESILFSFYLVYLRKFNFY